MNANTHTREHRAVTEQGRAGPPGGPVLTDDGHPPPHRPARARALQLGGYLTPPVEQTPVHLKFQIY